MQARIALVPQPQQRRETESIKSPRSTIKITLLRTLQRDVFVSNRNDNFRENPRRSRRQLNKRRKEAQKDQITRFAEKKTEGLKKYYKNLDQEASIAQVLDSNHNNGNQPLPFQFHGMIRHLTMICL